MHMYSTPQQEWITYSTTVWSELFECWVTQGPRPLAQSHGSMLETSIELTSVDRDVQTENRGDTQN